MNANIKDFAEMSDEDILMFDPSKLEDKTSAAGTAEDKNAADVTGGADSEENLSESDTDVAADSTSDGEESTSTDSQTVATTQQADASDQDASGEAAETTGAAEASGEVNYKSELAKVLEPFKADKRIVQVKSVEDARRLMSMGVDYSRKMADMKPYQKILKTLERNDLLDESKINFLIDLQKKNPSAMKKFFRDSEVDPHDLSYEDDTPYTPTNHMIPDQEMAVDAVLDSIRDTPSFTRTAKVITEEWDMASKRVLLDNPEGIRILNDHVASGIFDQIREVIESERTFGRLEGLSDLEAYKKIGDIHVPIIVRLQGTNAEEGAKIIEQSGLKVFSAIVLKDAAQKVKEVLK